MADRECLEKSITLGKRGEIAIETSARHAHLTQELVDMLLGKGTQLEPSRDLIQPGNFVCKQRLDIVGPKRTISGIAILGPCRDYTQIEISQTDARTLGIPAPIRDSGDLDNTPGCLLVGSAGEIRIEKGVIIARRHIHIKTADAKEMGINNKDFVAIRISKGQRMIIFEKVEVRMSAKLAENSMHIDTDEANAAGISGHATGEILVFD